MGAKQTAADTGGSRPAVEPTPTFGANARPANQLGTAPLQCP